jgi:energy-coupling factor transporter ATP-binding protein EcfA2
MAQFLGALAEAKVNILISGGTGSGKTTLLNILSSYISASERVVTGRLAVVRSGPVRAGEPHVVVGWSAGRQGRAFVAGGAILSPDGERLALARHTLVPTNWGVPLGLESWRT